MVVDTLLDNRYAINDTAAPPLGKGGMAIIYAGIDTETGDEIAAKTLLPDFQGDTRRRKRFRLEAEVLRASQHPHVVRLLDVIDGRRGTWILMERLQGETLRSKLESEQAFRPAVIDGWLAQTAAALEHMHVQGYVHLDITPQNIFLTDGNEVKLIDFGIAQRAWREPQREGDKLLGTAAYISPEHGSSRVVTPASDIYSLGCVVFELLTGKKIFSEHGDPSNDATVRLRQSAVPELPTSVAPERNLPAWVDTVVARALLPNPEERYPSMTAFAEAFHEKANPPLIRLNWSRKSKEHIPDTPTTTAIMHDRETVEQPVPPQSRGHTRVGGWARKELRSARRVLVVFALMMSLIIGLPMIGGNTIADWSLGLLPGSSTEVIGGNWNLRSSPDTGSEVLMVIQQGQSVKVTGAPRILATGMWWPVRATAGDQEVSGWAHDDGLKRTWLMNRVAGFTDLRNDLNSVWDDVLSWMPG
ncbi:MAG: serine/threonine protein kinase [Thermomicrobiales bacterium]|nr:serine/threonine protein kinase [Thermomicrobiales bacterium]